MSVGQLVSLELRPEPDALEPAAYQTALEECRHTAEAYE